jgi:hypothetical protein
MQTTYKRIRGLFLTLIFAVTVFGQANEVWSDKSYVTSSQTAIFSPRHIGAAIPGRE